MVDKDILLRYVYAKLNEAPKLSEMYTKVGGKTLKYRRVFFRLKKYVDEFLGGNKTDNRFVVLPGLRGVGKTTLLFQIYEYIEKKGIKRDCILYIPADELVSFFGAGLKDVIDVFIREIQETSLPMLDKKIFIMIDEAHYDRNWSQVGKIIYDQSKNVFTIFTGSSALGIEMGVDAARRAKKEAVFPLNFSEYLTLKHDFFPPRGTAESLKNLIFKYNRYFAETAIKKESEMKRRFLNLERPIEKEWKDFLYYGGFPFGIHSNQIDTYERIFAMVDRVIEKDVFSLKTFNTETRNTISRILMFLSLQKPGGTSDVKLAERLETSSSLVRSILEMLEKTHLIFSVRPYGGAGKIIRKPWKYYFLSPSVNAALKYKFGMLDRSDRIVQGILTENLVASYFMRLKETTGMPIGIFYDAEKGGVDFLLQVGDETMIPVEVGIGKKKEDQLKDAISRYNSPYGIIIEDREKLELKDKIIRIPIITFSFI